jgi:hypothetical protein
MITVIPMKPSLKLSLSVTLFFLACGLIFSHLAIGSQTLISFAFIKLEITNSIIGFWLMATISYLMASGGVWMLYLSLMSKKIITLTDTSISLPPKGKQKGYLEIPFKSILGFNEIEVYKTKTFYLYHTEGSYEFSTSMISSKANYEFLTTTLANQFKMKPE